MEQRWISEENLRAILAELAQEGRLIAPVKIGDEVVFRKVSGVEQICPDPEYVNSFIPPKELLLPARQRLLRYRIDDGVKAIEPEVEDIPEQVIFGIRSCDVAGIEYLTKFLSGEMFGRPDLADGLFMKRKERLTILSVVCQQPAETCMCVCCEGPFGRNVRSPRFSRWAFHEAKRKVDDFECGLPAACGNLHVRLLRRRSRP